MIRFRVDYFCPVELINFAVETFCGVFRKFLVAKKFMDKRGVGECQKFRSFFFLTVSKNFVGEQFSVSLIPGIEKFYPFQGYVTSFHRKFFASQSPKDFVEEPFSVVFQKNSGSQKVF